MPVKLPLPQNGWSGLAQNQTWVLLKHVWYGMALNQAWAVGELSMLLDIFKLLRERQIYCQELFGTKLVCL